MLPPNGAAVSEAELTKKLKAAFERAKAVPSCTSILIDKDSDTLDIVLDTKASIVGEWMPGEGADICLYRDRETGRVVGCHLPLYHKKVKVSRIGRGVGFLEGLLGRLRR
jgi:hypothetical protein